MYTLFAGAPVGNPSPPDNLRIASRNNMTSTTIMWDAPAYTGGDRITILKYRIQIPIINYTAEESGTTQSHTITADNTNIMFNTSYDVEVTAINTCEEESVPAHIVINIEGRGKYMVSCICTVTSTKLIQTFGASNWG